MEERTFLSANAFCRHHHIELTFIRTLHDHGLIDINETGEDCLLPEEQLTDLEKMVRLHYDLHINLEGIDAVNHLLHRVENLQKEVGQLRNRLQEYEGE